MQLTKVRSLGQEDPLEKEMATNSSILAWDRRLSMGQSMHTTQICLLSCLICRCCCYVVHGAGMSIPFL